MSGYTGIERIDKLLAEAKESENRFGNATRQIFLMDEDRYLFDFNMDLGEWSQFDTTQDAHYFGMWVHKERRLFLTYAEGDLYFTRCKDAESYDRELAYMCSAYEAAPAFTAIDPDEKTVTRYFEDRRVLFIDPENCPKEDE